MEYIFVFTAFIKFLIALRIVAFEQDESFSHKPILALIAGILVSYFLVSGLLILFSGLNTSISELINSIIILCCAIAAKGNVAYFFSWSFPRRINLGFRGENVSGQSTRTQLDK